MLNKFARYLFRAKMYDEKVEFKLFRLFYNIYNELCNEKK